MEYINKMIETYKKVTNKKLTDTQRKAIIQVILNSKIHVGGIRK